MESRHRRADCDVFVIENKYWKIYSIESDYVQKKNPNLNYSIVLRGLQFVQFNNGQQKKVYRRHG